METPPVPSEKYDTSDCEFSTVSRVIDGDTFETKSGRRIRLIGVDTPEKADPRKPVQWFAREASKKLKEWIDGETVCLRKDADKTLDTGKYGRSLRYVWKYEKTKPDAFLVNAEIIKQGFGFVYTRYPFQYLEAFRRNERYARQNNLGLWDRAKQKTWEQEYEKNRKGADTCGTDGTICPEDARNYFGELKTVRFLVEKSYDSGRAIFLNSKYDYRDPDNFTAVIFDADRHRFPPHPDDLYWGKAADVTGRIERYKGRAEIILEFSSQIIIIQ
jgi:micrococcal nuclease